MTVPADLPHCSGCGLSLATCATGGECTRRFEPPRFCSFCGRRLRVLVTPTGWKASCRDHGPVGHGRAPSSI